VGQECAEMEARNSRFDTLRRFRRCFVLLLLLSPTVSLDDDVVVVVDDVDLDDTTINASTAPESIARIVTRHRPIPTIANGI